MNLISSYLASAPDDGRQLQQSANVLLYAVVLTGKGWSDERSENYWEFLKQHPLFRDLSFDQAAIMTTMAIDALAAGKPVEAIRQHAQNIPAQLRPTVFALVADFAFADGALDSNENFVVSEIMPALQIERTQARAIIETMALKAGLVMTLT